MKKFTAEFLVLALVIFSGAPLHNRPAVFAAAAAPGQVPTPVPATPQLVNPAPVTGAPRLVGQAQANQQQQQQQEQLRIVADPATNSLIIYGTVQEYQNVKNILKELDAVPRQVLIEAMILQIDLTDKEDFGVDYELFRKSRQTIFGQTFGSSAAVTTLGKLFPSAGFPGVAGLSAIAGDNRVSAMIRAAATDSRIKIISSPSVIASDNKPARIQVGSEEPVPTGTLSTPSGGQSGFNTSTSVQYRNTGRILTIIPQVNSSGLVNLQIKAEVSARGEEVKVGQDSFPAFNTQDAETTAVVQDGETLVIGGLIGERKSKGRSGIPYLMDIPVLGRFFGTTNDSTERTELIMLITPRVIRNREESKLVTADFKAGLEKVRDELARIAKDRARLLPPRPQPPLPDPNQFYQPDQPKPESSAPTTGPRAALPAPAGSILMFSNDPLTGRMMPPMAVPQATLPVALAQNRPVAEPIAPAAPQAVAAPLPAPVNYLMSFAAPRPIAVPPVPQVSLPPVANAQTTDGSRRVWTVQVAAVGEKSAAESLAENLRRLGYDAYVRVVKGDNKTWHRVRIGQLASQKDAATLRNLLSSGNQHKDAYIALY